jgi:integrase/recombinase XerD
VNLHEDLHGGLKIAREYYQTLIRKLSLETLDLKQVFPISSRLTLQEFFAGYLDEREKAVYRGSLSPGTLRADYNAVNRFVKSLGASYPLLAVDEKRIFEYIDRALSAGYSKSTINIDIRHIGAALNKAVKNGIIPKNPFAEVPQLRVEKIPRHLWPEEEQVLREYFTALGIPYQQDFFEFDLQTGLRVEEIFNLEVNNLRGENIRVLGKGQKWRWVPVEKSGEMIERRRGLITDQKRLKKYLGDLPGVNLAAAESRARTGRLFFEISELTSFAHFILKARRRCDLPDKVKPHSLRHTFAVRFLESGGDIYLLSQLMGHSSVKTTEIYLYCTPELMRRVKHF